MTESFNIITKSPVELSICRLYPSEIASGRIVNFSTRGAVIKFISLIRSLSSFVSNVQCTLQ